LVSGNPLRSIPETTTLCFGNGAERISRNNEILFKSLKGEFIMTQEITLTLDNKLSDVLARVIVQLDAAQYEQAKRAAFKEMEQGFHLGGVPASRESLYER
jgi:hypothetical protein